MQNVSLLNQLQARKASSGSTQTVAEKKIYVQRRLKELGIGPFERMRMEARMLPRLLHSHEVIGAVLAGTGPQGHYMLVATNGRIIVIDGKPLFSNVEDITYFVVAGFSEGQVGALCTATLHTRLGDFCVKTTNISAALQFKRYIDERTIKQSTQGGGFVS